MSQRTTDTKSSLSQYVRDLANPDPAKRRRAIMKLGQTGDPEALKPLAEVYRSDPSVELRELARKAGVYIRQQEEAAARHEARGTQPLQKRVSPQDVQRARAYTDEALTLNIEGHNERAVNSLSKALNINPSLVEDTYFTGMASVILNLPKPEAMELLTNSQQRGQFAKSVTTQRKSAEVEEHMQAASRFTWRGTSLELALYLLICALGPVILIAVAAQGIQQMQFALTQPNAAKLGIPAFVNDFTGVIGLGTSLPALLLIGVTSVIGGLLNLLVQTAVVHGVSRYLLRGKGTFGYLLNKLVPLLARYVLIVCLVGSLAIGIGGSIGAFFLIYIAAFGLIMFTLFTGVKLLGAVGEVYHSGPAIGCASILLASIPMVVLNVIMITLLSQVLNSLLSGFVTPT